MLALGLQGSPRKKGNTDLLLSMFMDALAQMGVDTLSVDVCRRKIEPCAEYTVCEKKGFCPIDDDMHRDIYGLLRRADLIVLASPVFFYSVTAQLKALIDRCQTLWARKYVLKLNDPGYRSRRGFVLSVGATSGKQLFDGIHLTAKYFFDAVAAQFSGSLTYRRMESRGQITSHATVREDVIRSAQALAEGLLQRPKIIFACRQNACRSQMAAAFARLYAGDRLDVISAGSQPAQEIDPLMVEVMQEKGIDMGFCVPRPLQQAIDRHAPEVLVTMGCGEQCPVVPGLRLDWDVPDPAGQPKDFFRSIRDAIELKVKTFTDAYHPLPG
ncbi:MAG: flavin reductase [Desulfobacteraceae bacterium]|nr:MAG: flavin reductase [Desulfobacteraceae bacterium]